MRMMATIQNEDWLVRNYCAMRYTTIAQANDYAYYVLLGNRLYGSRLRPHLHCRIPFLLLRLPGSEPSQGHTYQARSTRLMIIEEIVFHPTDRYPLLVRLSSRLVSLPLEACIATLTLLQVI